MRFGVCFETDVGWEELLSVARELDERSAFEHLWVTDSLVGREPEGARLEAWTALAALARETARVRLGVLVSGNVFRPPALLAKAATTLDHLSGGRLEIGVGAGFPAENPRLGVPFPPVRERLERLDEAVQVIRLLWTEERPSFEGRHYRLERAPFQPPPLQRPHPPLLVGGASRAALRTAARHADGINMEGTPEEVRARYATLDRLCAEAGRDPKTLRRTHEILLFLGEDPAFERAVVRGAAEAYGRSEEEARRMVLLGSVAEVQEQVGAFRELGVEDLIVWTYPRVDRESLLRFSEEVIPAFRG